MSSDPLPGPPAHAVARAARFREADRIWVDPGRRSGRPCIRGTRIAVSDVLHRLAGGAPLEELLEDWPHVSREDLLAAVAYAAQVLEGDDEVETLAAWVLGSVEAAREWLDSPHPLLDGQPPREVATTPAGWARVKRLLDNLEHGLPL